MVVSYQKRSLLFCLGGRDKLAVPMLEYYALLCRNDGATDYQLDTMQIMIDRFKKFARDNPETMKQPGITKGL